MLERLELEAFLTLAEELHFGRTAERLHVTTSRVSQTIRQLERRIGAPLFERSSRRVVLTVVGKQLRDELRPAYDQIAAGVAAASSGNLLIRTLTVGFSAPWCGNLIIKSAKVFRDRYPGSVVTVEEIQLTDPLGRMRSGAVDLQLTEFPISEPDISTGPIIFSEPRSLMVPADHPFASRDSVSLEDLADTTLITINSEAVPRYWMDYYFPRRTPSGRPIPQGPAAVYWPEVLVHVSQGAGVSTVSAAAEQFHTRPGMAFVPFRDAPPIDYGLMWPTAHKNPLVRPFIETIRELADSA
ncbi:LysR family transcriptional regulator [Nocardia sp. XZ_19_385]|uniref:LysR family transcriptional regulator n=1 Tax=Nocardia sp. XZ_19_385 TaxID=2769488 RepID=UPI00188DF133|nr:LysR family transcriptional regulator [Nocardia sp. XZ_19_385]